MAPMKLIGHLTPRTRRETPKRSTSSSANFLVNHSRFPSGRLVVGRLANYTGAITLGPWDSNLSKARTFESDNFQRN